MLVRVIDQRHTDAARRCRSAFRTPSSTHIWGRSGPNTNRRNGSSQKTVLTGSSKMRVSIPRDRAGTFDPKLIARYQRRFPDFDDKIVSMYARGMTVREIRGHLEELYGIEVSPDLISAVTDAVLEEVTEWQNRP